MLTPEAGNTQWMEEHEEEACGLLRKPLGLGRFNIPRIVGEIVVFQTFKSVLMPNLLLYFLLRNELTFSLFDAPLLFSDIKRKCSKTDCKNLEKEVGEFDRLFLKSFLILWF